LQLLEGDPSRRSLALPRLSLGVSPLRALWDRPPQRKCASRRLP